MAAGNISHYWHKITSESSVLLLLLLYFSLSPSPLSLSLPLSQGTACAEELDMPSIVLD
jgi:hypothetical protein